MSIIMCGHDNSVSDKKINSTLKNIDKKVNEADNLYKGIYERFDYDDNKIIEYLSKNTVSYREWSDLYNFFRYYQNDQLIYAIIEANIDCSDDFEKVSVMLRKEKLKRVVLKIKKDKDKNYALKNRS